MPQSYPAVSQRPVGPFRLARRLALAATATLLLGAPAALAQDGGGAEASEGATGTTGTTGPVSTPAPAPAAPAAVATPLSRATIRAVQRKLKVKPDGALGPRTRAAIRRFQKRHALTVDGRLQPATLEALGVKGKAATATPFSDAPIPADAKLLLDAIAQCESGGDPTMVSASGEHRGKYQFLVATWESVGGVGDPAVAPEAEQDQRAASLLAKQGTKPWPVCGPKAEKAQAPAS